MDKKLISANVQLKNWICIIILYLFIKMCWYITYMYYNSFAYIYYTMCDYHIT